MEKGKVYLDYNATTPLAPEVRQAIISAMRDAWGNPSSSHDAGRRAREIIEEARSNIASMIGAMSSDIIFVSGGTEANNWTLQMAIKYFYNQTDTEQGSKDDEVSKPRRPHLISSNVEHDSVKLVLEHFEKERIADVTYISVSNDGRVEVDDVISALRPTTVMISIMLANNETGVIQPIAEICERLRHRAQTARRVLVHTDAAQALGKVPVDVEDLGVDFLTIVGHKFYAPRIGALYIRNPGTEIPVYPMLFGGGQEKNFRPGTENTPMIAGLGTAAELVHRHLSEYQEHMKQVRDYLEKRLEEEFNSGVHFNGKSLSNQRLPNTCNVSFVGKGLQGHKVLQLTKQVQASVGAACHAQNKPSHILLAMGLSEDLAHNALRLSVGRETCNEDIDVVVADLKQAIASIENL